MKRILLLLGVAASVWACSENTAGDRTYQERTMTDSANAPTTNQHDDTTATTNNDIYNTDSMPPNTTIEEKGSSTSQTTPNQEEQARKSAGASVPQNQKPEGQ